MTPKPRAIDSVPTPVLEEIQELRALTSGVRGFTPLDSPKRVAIPDLAALIFATLETYGVTTHALSKRLGLNETTLNFWLKRHGYRANSPSRPDYMARQTGRREPIQRKGAEPMPELATVWGPSPFMPTDELYRYTADPVEDAAAMRTLERYGCSDLAEMLGLS